MIRVALKGLLGRKVRAALTALAVVIGVAMISGSFVLSDTLGKSIDGVYADSYQSADAVVTGAGGSSMHAGGAAVSFPGALLDRIGRLEGVRSAEGGLEDEARLLDATGKPIGSTGLAFATDDSADHGLSPLKLTEGRWPRGDREIAIDKATADAQGLEVGESIGAYAGGPVAEYRISGIVRFGTADTIASATMAVFDLAAGQTLFGKQGKLDLIRVAAGPGVAQDELIERIRPLLPATAQVATASAQAEADSSATKKTMDFIKYFLLAFGGIALVVGSFVIANTLSITVAQRTREFATVRTLGGSRRQILGSVVVESLAIGIVGSAAGLFLGLALASGLIALLQASGFELPGSDIVFATRTIVVSVGAGTVIALLAGLRPALRATRIEPITAVREGAGAHEATRSRRATAATTGVFAAALALLGYSAFATGAETQPRVAALAGGVLALFAGAVLGAPRVARPLARVLGAPGARIAGAAGALARENAARNPSRTAATAAAIMIGLALISFVAVVGQGFRASVTSAAELITADHVLTGPSGSMTLVSHHAAHVAATVPGAVVSEVRTGEATFAGSEIHVGGVDPNVTDVLDLAWTAGDVRVPARLGRTGAVVTDSFAREHAVSRGSTLRLSTSTGETLAYQVRGIVVEPKIGSPLSDVTISKRAFDAAFESRDNRMILVDGADGKALAKKLAGFPDVRVETREQFEASELEHVASMLNILYLLLAMSVSVSLLGVMNTLVLAVFERTRELGMLRAIGMTRRQVRRMIRHESIVTALLGATLGIAVGLLLAGVATLALEDYGVAFAVPYGALATIVLVAIGAGMVAAILPARRAANLDVLPALQHQ